MTMRCKMKLISVVPFTYGGVQAVFSCQYDPKLIEEDVTFAKATPSGTATYTIDNPTALAQLVIGQDYYVDFTSADAPKAE